MENKHENFWKDTRFHSSGSRMDIGDIIAGKKHTALEQLAARYKRFSRLGLAFSLMSVVLLNPNIIPGASYRPWLATLYAVLMLTASCMDYWLWKGIESIDVLTMTVSEVARRAMFYRKRHLQFIAVLLPMAFAFMFLMGISVISEGDKYLLSGMITGGVTGLLMGLNELRKFMRDYRDITRE